MGNGRKPRLLRERAIEGDAPQGRASAARRMARSVTVNAANRRSAGYSRAASAPAANRRGRTARLDWERASWRRG